MDIHELCSESDRIAREHGFQCHWHNVPEKLMLVVTELAEAMEAYRHLKPATLSSLDYSQGYKITAALLDDEQEKEAYAQGEVWENFREEIADAFIRLGNLSHALHLDIKAAIEDKMRKNEERPFMHGKNC